MSSTLAPITITLAGDQTGVECNGTSVLRCANASLLTIHGIASGYAGQPLTILSVGTGQVNIANESSTDSEASNRIVNGVTGTRSLVAGKGSATLVYDASLTRWRLLEQEQGAWIFRPYDSGNFTGNDSMIWTVESTDVLFDMYYLKGVTLHVSLRIQGSSVGGTPSSLLQVAVAGGFNLSTTRGFAYISDNGTSLLTRCNVSGVVFSFNPLISGGTWAASTNNTSVQTQFFAQVP